jgi:hypothetical protein
LNISSYIISPTGKKIRPEVNSTYTNPFFIDKADVTGTYKLYVLTKEINERGKLKIESFGNFIAFPKIVEVKKNKIEDFWTTKNINLYRIEFKEGDQEFMLRAKTGIVKMNLRAESENKFENTYTLTDPAMKNIIFNVKRNETFFLEVETDNISGGNYELLLWGNYEKIEKIENVQLKFSIYGDEEPYPGNYPVIVKNVTKNTTSVFKPMNFDNNFNLFLEKESKYILELDDKRIHSEIIKIDLINHESDVKDIKFKFKYFNKGSKLNFHESYFVKNKADLTEDSKVELKNVLSKAMNMSEIKLVFTIGTFDFLKDVENVELSKLRRKVIEKYCADLEFPMDKYLIKLNSTKSSKVNLANTFLINVN